MSPGVASVVAVLIADALFSIISVVRACWESSPAAICESISSGSSVRGLSEVSMVWSLSDAAMRAITGRLSLSLSPPQPTTVIMRPFFFISASVSNTFLSASGVWA